MAYEAWRLIRVWGSRESWRLKGGSIGCCSFGWPSLSSAIRIKNIEEYQWPRLKFSSQLKHSPFFLRTTISSGDKHFSGNEGGFGGVGSRGWVGGEGTWKECCGEGEGGRSGRPRKEWQWSWSFSSWSRASIDAWTMVRGCRAWTSRRIFGAKLERKQISKNGGGRPMIWLASVSNCDK